MAAIIGALINNNRKVREYKNNSLYTDLNDNEIHARYRFSSDGINFITDLLFDKLNRKTNRSHAMSVKEQVMVALRYYASGSFMQVVGDTVGRDKSTVSRTIEEVTDALCSIKNDFIEWPVLREIKDMKKQGFYKLAGFPGVLGCVDGTHIRIKKPSENQRGYINRKHYASINVMAVVDHQGKSLLQISM